MIAKAFNAEEKLSEYTKIAEKHLGKGRKVQDCTETQIDMLILILSDLEDKAEELSITF